MGYSTYFKGQLDFIVEPTASQLAALKSMFGEDCRDHPEWDVGSNLSYVDLKLSEDFTGILHDGSEKTYDLHLIINMVIREMRKKCPDFGLTGKLFAQGEDYDDRWELVIGDNGWAKKVKTPLVGTVVECPRCEEKFVLEEALEDDRK